MSRILTFFFLLGLSPSLVVGQAPPIPGNDAVDTLTRTTCLFHFVPGRDAFYVPWRGNQLVLDTLMSVVRTHLPQLREGRLFIHVAGYAPTGSPSCGPVRTGYLRNCRVKSELITRVGATEEMFLTDRYHPETRDGRRDVVVVTFPVNAAGEETPIEAVTPAETVTPVEAAAANPAPCDESTNDMNKSGTRSPYSAFEMDPVAESDRPDFDPSPVPDADSATVSDSGQIPACGTSCREVSGARRARFALHTNLLRWATLTPDAGIEWRFSRRAGIVVNGTYTSWTWQGKERRYALWKVAPELRWYLGAARRGYLGAMFQAGSFNYKLSTMGRQGDFLGGGIVGGYLIPIGHRLALDLAAGAGCTHADYEKYRVIDGIRVRQGRGTKNYWGVNHLSVGLVWTFGGNE